MKRLEDNDRMPFGKYKNEKMANVPATYLLWLYDNIGKGHVKDYIGRNMDILKDEIAQGIKNGAKG